MRDEFRKEVEDSLYIHTMLPLHKEKSLEASFPEKKVLKRKDIWSDTAAQVPLPGERGEVSICTEDQEEYINITARTRYHEWPAGAPSDGDYSNFGRAEVSFRMDQEDWRDYNRLCFQVKPQVPGAEVVHVNVGIKNEGTVKIPDRFCREGFTVFDLKNNEWNECFWEFPSLPRDCVTKLQFYVLLNGQDTAMGQELAYGYKNIRIEAVERPEKEHGWECAPGLITLSYAGYLPQGSKTAIANVEESCFQVLEEKTNRVVYTGMAAKVNNERGSFQILDFSNVCTEGYYYIKAGEVQSPVFEIGTGFMEESVWRVINFLYGERCGMPVSGKHGACHFDVVARHNGLTMPYAGGWHDAGDVSQQSAQTGEIVHALLEVATKYKERNPKLYKRLLEEAKWGLDFVLRTRFGDGYRATSAGLTRWTNGKIGDMDDVEVRVHNHAYENFLFAGIEAYAWLCLKEDDEPLALGSLEAAKADFCFAEQRFREYGMEAPIMFEHTYNSGLSQYYAVIVWAASTLYKATGECAYAEKAEYWCDKLIACQEQGEAGLPFSGFFYRDETHKMIVHFNHQAREQQFIQALAGICEACPESARKPVWEDAMKRYAGYLKAISTNTAPYGMLPAGVYQCDEYLDREVFPYLHVMCDYEEEKNNYEEQLKQGKRVGEKHVIKNFPVWFSFRGNTVVLLSEGKAASLLGQYLKDEELMQMGREQLYWVFGKNPFGHSLLYGAGSRYPSQYAVFPGECVGEIPVGIETRDNEDIPYWPQGNNATYREVWTSAASRWLWLAADYVGNENPV